MTLGVSLGSLVSRNEPAESEDLPWNYSLRLRGEARGQRLSSLHADSPLFLRTLQRPRRLSMAAHLELPTSSVPILPTNQPSGATTLSVVRRNGTLSAFDPSKISIAISKAFVAVEGTGAEASQRIHATVETLTGADCCHPPAPSPWRSDNLHRRCAGPGGARTDALRRTQGSACLCAVPRRACAAASCATDRPVTGTGAPLHGKASGREDRAAR